MSQEHNNILEAKQSLKEHILLLKTLVKHLNGRDKVFRGRAMWAAWCLHRYFNDRLIGDIQEAIEKNTPPDGKHNA